jgi:hypothetical protein
MALAPDVMALGTNSEDGSDTTFTLTLGAAVASGAYIFMGLHAGDVSISSVADNGAGGSLTWTLIKTEISATGRRIWLYRAYAPSGRASGVVVTVTFATATSFKSGLLSSFTGAPSSSPEDTAATSSTTANQTSWSGAAITTSTADCLILGLAETDGNGTPTNTAAGSYTEANEVGIAAQVSMALVYRIVTASGTHTPQGTWSSSQSGTGQAYVTAAIKAQAGNTYEKAGLAAIGP